MTIKKGLGRGLDAILGKDEGSEMGFEEVPQRLPVSLLEPNRYQPRSSFDEEGLEELARSIEAQGVIQPLVVAPARDGRYTIIAGERRWRAAQRCGLEDVPVVVRSLEDDQQLLELALVENLQRTDLNPIEEAEAYRTLRETFHLSQEAIGGRVGRSRVAITNSLRLLRLPAEVQDQMRAGRLTAGQARPLLALESSTEQIELAKRAVKQGLTARRLESLVRARTTAADQKKPPPAPDVHAVAAAERLTRRLQTKVEIRRRGRGGEVRIHFHSEDELMRLYDRLLGQAAASSIEAAARRDSSTEA